MRQCEACGRDLAPAWWSWFICARELRGLAPGRADRRGRGGDRPADGRRQVDDVRRVPRGVGHHRFGAQIRLAQRGTPCLQAQNCQVEPQAQQRKTFFCSGVPGSSAKNCMACCLQLGHSSAGRSELSSQNQSFATDPPGFDGSRAVVMTFSFDAAIVHLSDIPSSKIRELTITPDGFCTSVFSPPNKQFLVSVFTTPTSSHRHSNERHLPAQVRRESGRRTASLAAYSWGSRMSVDLN